MDILIVVIVVVVMVGAAATAVVIGLRRAGSARVVPVAWQQAATRLGLQYRCKPETREARLSGQRSGMGVRIELVERNASTATEIGLLLDRRAPGDAHVRRASFLTRSRGDAVTIGDPAFDDVVHITGNPVWVRAVLDDETRTQLAELVTDDGIELRNRELVWTRRGVVRDRDTLVDSVETLEQLGRRLCLTRHMMRGALTRISRADPLVAVRAGALRVLLSDYPRADETKQATLRAFVDPDLEMQRLALEALPLTAHRRLERIAFGEGRRESGTHPQIQAMAFERWLSTRSPDNRLESIARALAAPSQALWRPAALAALEIARGGEGLCGAETLLDGLLRDKLASLSPVRRADDDIEVAVIEALGGVGSLDAVEVLLERSTGLLTSTAVKVAARAAITAIQARSGTSTDGALSLADTTEARGAVSVVGDG